MKDYGRSARMPQLSKTASAIKRTEGLPFKDVFSGHQVSSAIAKTVPDFRNRAFPP
jgi:hypothetical protein